MADYPKVEADPGVRSFTRWALTGAALVGANGVLVGMAALTAAWWPTAVGVLTLGAALWVVRTAVRGVVDSTVVATLAPVIHELEEATIGFEATLGVIELEEWINGSE